MTVILGTADRYRVVGPDAALAVGGTIALCGLIALPIDGASMNPARSLGPAVVAGELGNVWIYVVGPAVGGAAGGAGHPRPARLDGRLTARPWMRLRATADPVVRAVGRCLPAACPAPWRGPAHRPAWTLRREPFG